MSTPAGSPVDQALRTLLNGPEPSTVADVIALLQAIDTLLPVTDGLKWFNHVYLSVTQQVDLNPPGGAWRNPIWLDRLDVFFAGFYVTALRSFLGGVEVPSSWAALLQARYEPNIDRIQFALAGFNAHINHDLALALIATEEALNLVLAPGGPEHGDYLFVNALLRELTPQTLTLLATDTLGMLAQDTGKVGRVLSFWDIAKARDLAWDFANHLRGFDGLSRTAALDAQEGLTGALGRAILMMVRSESKQLRSITRRSCRCAEGSRSTHRQLLRVPRGSR